MVWGLGHGLGIGVPYLCREQLGPATLGIYDDLCVHRYSFQECVLTAGLWLMGLLNAGRWYQIIFFVSHGCCITWVLIIWGSPRRTWLFPVLLKNMRGSCRETKDNQHLPSKAGLGRHSGQSSEGEQLGWAGGCMCSLSALLYTWPSSLCPSLPPHTSSVLWRPGESGCSCGGQGLRAGVEGTPVLATSVSCASAWMLQQEIRGSSGLNEACKSSYSAIRKDKAKNSKIKLRWSLTTFMFFSFVPNYKTLECDDFIWKQVAPLWQQQPNSKWEFLFHAPDKGLVLFSCQCAEDGPAVCWWYWKQSNCLFKKLSNKETPKWNGFFSPIFCWRIWNLTGHHGGCSVKGLESWSLGRAVTANYLCPGWEVLVHLVLRQV